ncbi:DUF3618 domain-containing protein [Micromonospora tulbaghiae]|uniref:DUF3618 domain-containing protein n=1 Tax=Micromonospora tulbaghiae TaxID=479978 RepID=UPI00340D54F1
MTAADSGDLDTTRQDIQHTRAQLGDTVAALVAKTDVKTRLRAKATARATGLRTRAATTASGLHTKAATAAGDLRQRLIRARQSARATTGQLTGTGSRKASERVKPFTHKVRKTATRVRDAAKARAQTTGEVETALVTNARTAITKIGGTARGKPLPLLAATTAAGLAVVAYRRRRSR